MGTLEEPTYLILSPSNVVLSKICSTVCQTGIGYCSAMRMRIISRHFRAGSTVLDTVYMLCAVSRPGRSAYEVFVRLSVRRLIDHRSTVLYTPAVTREFQVYAFFLS